MINQQVEAVQEIALKLWMRIPARLRQIVLGVAGGLFLALVMQKNIYYGIVLALLLAGLSVLLFEPAVTIYAMVLLLPLGWLTVMGERLKAITVLTMPAFAYAMFFVLYRRRKLEEPLVWACVALISSWFISMLNAVDVGWSLFAIKVPLFSYLFAFAMFMFIDTEDKLKVVWWILVFHGLWLSVLAVFQSFGGAPFFPLVRLGLVPEGILTFYKEAEIYRASGTFESGPRFALFMLAPFSLALARAIDLQRPISSRMLWAFASVVMSVGLLLSLTRAVFIIIPLIAYLIYKKAGRGIVLVRTAVSILVIASITTAILYWMLPATVWEALARRFSPSGTTFYMDRTYFMYIAFRAFLENPLTGVGIGNFPLHSWDLMQKYPAFWYTQFWDIHPLAFGGNITVHNSYVRMLAETSIWGLGAMIAIIVLTFRNYSYALKRLKGTDIYLPALAMFACFVGMVIYWFPHEYFLEEPYTSVLPIAFSAVLKKIADRYGNLRAPSSSP